MSSSEDSTIISTKAQAIRNYATLLSSALSVSGKGVQRPLRAAEQALPVQHSEDVKASSVCCKVPSLVLHRQESAVFPSSSKAVLEEAAASNLLHPMEVKRNDLSNLPIVLLWNLSKSFISLVDSRLRSTLTAVLRRSKSITCSATAQREKATAVILSRLLKDSSSAVSPTAIITTFRTLAFSEGCSDDENYISSLVMEAVVDLNIFGNQVTIQMEAPGTISASFSTQTVASDGASTMDSSVSMQKAPPGISRVDVDIDTSVLLQSMISQAKVVVRQAVGFAAGMATQLQDMGTPSSLASAMHHQRFSNLGKATAPVVSDRISILVHQAMLEMNSTTSDPCLSDGPTQSVTASQEEKPVDQEKAQDLSINSQPGSGQKLYGLSSFSAPQSSDGCKQTQPSCGERYPTWGSNHINGLALITKALTGLKREEDTVVKGQTDSTQGAQHHQQQPEDAKKLSQGSQEAQDKAVPV